LVKEPSNKFVLLALPNADVQGQLLSRLLRQRPPNPAGSAQQVEPARLDTLGIDDLMALKIPDREMLLDPILPAKGLMMIHAKRGGSKTFLALAMGLAVAGGTSLLRRATT
jgi:hypothetical protein